MALGEYQRHRERSERSEEKEERNYMDYEKSMEILVVAPGKRPEMQTIVGGYIEAV